MARRKKTSPIEDLMELVAILPWWAGVGLVLVSYLLLHAVASQPVVAATQVGQMGVMVTQTLWKTFASVGQYALPIVCLAGAGMSAWKRKQRGELDHKRDAEPRKRRARWHELARVRDAGGRGVSAPGLQGR